MNQSAILVHAILWPVIVFVLIAAGAHVGIPAERKVQRNAGPPGWVSVLTVLQYIDKEIDTLRLRSGKGRSTLIESLLFLEFLMKQLSSPDNLSPFLLAAALQPAMPRTSTAV